MAPSSQLADLRNEQQLRLFHQIWWQGGAASSLLLPADDARRVDAEAAMEQASQLTVPSADDSAGACAESGQRKGSDGVH